MALYVLGDPHLSFTAEKPMDIFGGAWDGYVDKLRMGLSRLEEADTLVLAGDISWGMSLSEAEADFRFLNEFPCRKILLKGNHDYWWTTAAKMNAFFADHGWQRFALLHNNAIPYESAALCGTRGWFPDETGDSKVFRRELMRLETSLRAAGDRQPLVFLHYPPLYQGYRCEEILALLHKYGVKRCYYGHLHGHSHRLAIEGPYQGVEFHLVSADYLEFQPLKILDF